MKLDKTSKTCFKIFRVFDTYCHWHLLSQLNWVLGSVSTQIWYFSNIFLISWDPNSATREAARVASLLCQISSIILLVAIWTCGKLLKIVKILWPALSANFSFALYTSIDDSTIWEEYQFWLQNVTLFKKQLSDKVESFLKSNFDLNQRYKIVLTQKH